MFGKLPLKANLFAIVALAAALLQWSIPQGWMIGTDAEGDLVFMPCPSAPGRLARFADTGHMAHMSAVHADHAAMGHAMHHQEDGSGPGMAETVCDQAALGTPALLSHTTEPTAPFESDDDPLGVSPESIPGRGLAAPPPPATGPPILIA